MRLSTYVETPVCPVKKGFTAPKVARQGAKTRRANLGDGYHETPVFRGADLAPGHEIVGPAIIEESFTTIVRLSGMARAGGRCGGL